MKSNRLEKLEAVRGFAALYVVFFHILPQKIELFGINIGYLFRFGPEMVIVFFVLSGFVIKFTYERSKDKSFGYYFIRRFIRLYIPLLIVFALAYLIRCFEAGGWANPEIKNLIGNLFMLQDVISLKPNVIVPSYLGNGVLWSLSYEWWFYMLFFVLATYIKPEKINRFVTILTIVAAASYLIYPFIVNRLVMYFAIWWTGVRFADIYLKKGEFSFKAIMPQAILLITISIILAINLKLNFEFTKIYAYPLVAYPFVELRHFVFTIMVLFGAILWKQLKWIGFELFVGKFKYLASSSYVIYIAHHYLVVEAHYLSFINNKIIEYGLYVIVLLVFSYLLEVIVYNRIKKLILK